jgi:K+-transporting ATPase ATPase A chain
MPSRCLLFSIVSMLVLYVMQRVQQLLAVQPQGFGAVAPDLAFKHRCLVRHKHELAGI